jgi:hypothetical protein
MRSLVSWLAGLAGLVGLAGLTGCGAPGEAERRCDALRARVVECAKQPWPPGALEHLHRYCVVSLAYTREPGDQPGNLAEVTKEKLTECAAAVTCGELEACFTKHRCQLIFARPGAQPTFQCW